MGKQKIVLSILVQLLFLGGLFSQSLNISLNNDLQFQYEDSIYNGKTLRHTSVKPFLQSNIGITDYKNDSTKSIFTNGVISPVLTGGIGYSQSDLVYNSGIGIRVKSNIGKQFAFDVSISENYNRYPLLYDNRITPVSIPHYGAYNVNNHDYIYTDFNGYLSYSPNSYFNFQLGKYKNFFGDGYRSILLSDNSNSNWFLKGSVDIWRIKYTIIYNYFEDIDCNDNTYKLHDKYSTVHHLSWNIGKRINFNLFETVIWHGEDTSGYRGFDVNYLNPIIFYRPVEFSLGSPDNVVMGGGYKLRIAKTNHIYGQVLLDEFKLAELKAKSGWWGNKYGYQIGFKTYNLLNVKRLFWLIEYNRMRPFTFSHWSSLENWGNYYQAMAHPLGANFDELVSIFKYPYKKWLFKIKAIYSRHGEDFPNDSINYGGNIYRSYNDNINEYGNTMLQGNLISLTQVNISASYMIMPVWNLRAEAGIIYRNIYNTTDFYYYAGIKTNIFNNEIDY